MEQPTKKKVPRKTAAKKKVPSSGGTDVLTKPQRYPVERNLTNHPPSAAVAAEMEAIRTKLKTLARYLDKTLPDGREKSLAFTNLEQTTMWIMASLARP